LVNLPAARTRGDRSILWACRRWRLIHLERYPSRRDCPQSSWQHEQPLVTCHNHLFPKCSLSAQVLHLGLQETSFHLSRVRTASTLRSVGLHWRKCWSQLSNACVCAHYNTHTHTHTHTVACCDLPRKDAAFQDDAIVDPYVSISLVETSTTSPFSVVSHKSLQTGMAHRMLTEFVATCRTTYT